MSTRETWTAIASGPHDARLVQVTNNEVTADRMITDAIKRFRSGPTVPVATLGVTIRTYDHYPTEDELP